MYRTRRKGLGRSTRGMNDVIKRLCAGFVVLVLLYGRRARESVVGRARVQRAFFLLCSCSSYGTSTLSISYIDRSVGYRTAVTRIIDRRMCRKK